MNWDAIAAVGELVGAVGVVVSLLYLASQVRQNTLTMRATSAASAAQSMREIIGPFLVDPSRSGLVARGFEDPDSLSGDEKAYFVNISFNLGAVISDGIKRIKANEDSVIDAESTPLE